jgi:hypothetical protein
MEGTTCVVLVALAASLAACDRCAPGDERCYGNTIQKCASGDLWNDYVDAQECPAGTVCVFNPTACSDQQPHTVCCVDHQPTARPDPGRGATVSSVIRLGKAAE